ncbi:MAG: hypothetical protein KC563_03820, partial [Nitrospira sp.]|nr:hypothetical protein [Nitrospira sp.]
MPRISILTATAFEFRSISRVLPGRPRRVWHSGHSCLMSQQLSDVVLLMQTGIGPQKAHSMAQRLLQGGNWDLVISTGFAGALQDLPIGTLVFGEEVLDDPFAIHPGVPILCDTQWLGKLAKISHSRIPFTMGRFVAVPCVLTRSEEKREMGSATGALAVDMESGAIGRAARKVGVSFAIIRAISDGIEEDLPLDFNIFHGPVGWMRGLWGFLRSPHVWRGMFRLYRQSREASAQLTKFFE